MKFLRRFFVPVSLLASAFAQQKPVMEGEYIEERSNRVYGCYCEWSGESLTAGKEAILAWKILRGQHSGTDLSGLTAAAVIVGEDTLSIGDAPRQSVLFLHRGARPAQRKAGEAMLREYFGHLLGKVVAVYTEDITFERSGEEAAVRIGSVASARLRKAVLPDDALPGSVRWFDPFIPLKDATLGTSLGVRYSGGDFDRRWMRDEAGVNGYFGRFVWPPAPSGDEKLPGLYHPVT